MGEGVRATFRATEQPNDSHTNNVDLDNARLYVNAQAHESFLVELNTEYAPSMSNVKVLDAVVKFGPSEYFNVWVGRHLPPSDRANLDGTFFLSAYDYPGLVSRYPAIFLAAITVCPCPDRSREESSSTPSGCTMAWLLPVE